MYWYCNVIKYWWGIVSYILTWICSFPLDTRHSFHNLTLSIMLRLNTWWQTSFERCLARLEIRTWCWMCSLHCQGWGWLRLCYQLLTAPMVVTSDQCLLTWDPDTRCTTTVTWPLYTVTSLMMLDSDNFLHNNISSKNVGQKDNSFIWRKPMKSYWMHYYLLYQTKYFHYRITM